MSVRRARVEDLDVLVRFNLAMAEETEGRRLAPEVVEAGVRGIFEQPNRGFYLVAEATGKGRGPGEGEGAGALPAPEVVGSLMVTREWSDWRNADFWWVQSVYVLPAWRRRSVFRRLYGAVRAVAIARSGVCGLRLYVERENRSAQATYTSLGMHETGYRLWEESFG